MCNHAYRIQYVATCVDTCIHIVAWLTLHYHMLRCIQLVEAVHNVKELVERQRRPPTPPPEEEEGI